MYEADDLIPPEILSWMMEKLRLFRLSGAHGSLQLNVQDGHILSYEDTQKHKATRRTTRYRTKPEIN